MKTQAEVEAEVKALIEQHAGLGEENIQAKRVLIHRINALGWVLGVGSLKTLLLSEGAVDLMACLY